MISIHINQTPITLDAPCTLAEAIQHLVTTQEGVALALNGTVVRKAEWHKTQVAHGDELHLFRAVAGG